MSPRKRPVMRLFGFFAQNIGRLDLHESQLEHTWNDPKGTHFEHSVLGPSRVSKVHLVQQTPFAMTKQSSFMILLLLLPFGSKPGDKFAWMSTQSRIPSRFAAFQIHRKHNQHEKHQQAKKEEGEGEKGRQPQKRRPTKIITTTIIITFLRTRNNQSIHHERASQGTTCQQRGQSQQRQR